MLVEQDEVLAKAEEIAGLFGGERVFERGRVQKRLEAMRKIFGDAAGEEIDGNSMADAASFRVIVVGDGGLNGIIAEIVNERHVVVDLAEMRHQRILLRSDHRSEEH